MKKEKKTEDIRYLRYEEVYLEYAYQALRDRFVSKQDFLLFFNSIASDEDKDHFLRISSFYLFLVKEGDFFISIPNVKRRIDYITDSYKYIAIFSLIEALYTRDDYIDFYTFLTRKKSSAKYPINTRDELESLFKQYNADYGAIQKAIRFFKSLDSQWQNLLTKKLIIKGSQKPIREPIEFLSKYLYELRSKFIHKAEFVLILGQRPVTSKGKGKIVISELTLQDIMLFFEHGLIKHFKAIPEIQD